MSTHLFTFLKLEENNCLNLNELDNENISKYVYVIA